MNETAYQAYLIGQIKEMLPDCFIIRNDPKIIQGIPDLLILDGDRWAMLEVKKSSSAPEQANQTHYVELFSSMSYASFIYPENEEDVLIELQRSFTFGR